MKANRKLRFRSALSGYIILLPALIVMVAFNFYPIIWSFLVSFKTARAIDIKNSTLFQIPGVFVGLDNYIKVLQNDLFFKSIVNTGYFAIMFIPLTLLSSLLLAIYVNQKFKGVNFFRTIIFIPYIISVISSSLVFMTLFNTEAGFVNASLELVGIKGISWLGNEKLAMPVIALMSIWRRVGYFMLLYLAGLQNISKSMYEAADIDGANAFVKFKSITVPLLSKITVVIMVLLLRDALTIFQEVFVMTGGGPGNSTVTVPFLIYQEAFSYLRFGTAAAMSYILFVLAFIIIIVQNKIINRKGNTE
jgi:multiple sugar transport system permease protein